MRKVLIVSLAAAAVALMAGCGSDDSDHSDVTARELMAKVHVRMGERDLAEALGKPDRSVLSSTGTGTRFNEYDTKDGTVAVTVSDGIVTDFKLTGEPDEGTSGPAQGTTGAPPG